MRLKDFIFQKIAVFLIILLTVAMFPVTVFLGSSDAQTEEESACKDSSCIEEKWGIKILSLRVSANGYILDFRYRLIDPKKAAPLFDIKNKPYLIDQASGVKCYVPKGPKVGSLRTTKNSMPNKNYFILFGNPGKFIKAGNKVTVVVGDFKAENLIVE